jgi:hypothetical protein
VLCRLLSIIKDLVQVELPIARQIKEHMLCFRAAKKFKENATGKGKPVTADPDPSVRGK